MLRTLFLALTVVLLVPLAANFMGWNVFLTQTEGERMRTIACSLGTLHLSDLAYYGEYDPGDDAASGLDDLEPVTLLKFGAAELFVEPRLDPVQLLRFYRLSEGSDKVLEIPWLIFPVVALLGAFASKRRRRQPAD